MLHPRAISPLLILLFLHHLAPPVTGGEAEALLALKSALDNSNRLPWRPDTASTLCTSWPGIRQCGHGGRVTKLVLENLNLTGFLTAALLSPFPELRVLSLKDNALSGPVPAGLPAALPNLKLLYLSGNRLTGEIPPDLASLRRATVLVLSGNRLTGEIPEELADAPPRLTALMLDGNLLAGPVPGFSQRTLRVLDVSGNRLSGRIPPVLAARFNASSFAGNGGGLCGPPLPTLCDAAAPLSPARAAFSPLPPPGGGSSSSSRRRKKAAIVAGSTVAGAVLLGVLAAAVIMASRRGRGSKQRVAGDEGHNNKAEAIPSSSEQPAASAPLPPPAAPSAAMAAREFSWEREGGMEKLVFCGGGGVATAMYSLEELLRASAEMLGRGEAGSTYKAVMETGFIVKVKRMRCGGGDVHGDAAGFGRRAEELGRVRHPIVVALRAYFQAKEERLLVYDYYPNGSLFSLIHGSRPSSKGKPLHWTSCMKIAEDIAAGLLHLHTHSTSSAGIGIVHGNLKPSNVLLGPDFESCLTDYGLVPALHSPSSAAAASLLYRAPETTNAGGGLFTAASDVYSFGVLLLELLTGRVPFQDLLQGDDIPARVCAACDEETSATTESNGGDLSATSNGVGGAEEKLGALVGVAAACVAADPGSQPAMAEVLWMVREARAEAMSSSNSSNLSPARWFDAVVSLPPPQPRDHGADSFADRD